MRLANGVSKVLVDSIFRSSESIAIIVNDWILGL